MENEKIAQVPTGKTGYAKIRAALHAINLTSAYMDQFENNRVSDEGVNMYIKFPGIEYIRKNVETIIEDKDHLNKFMEAYKNGNSYPMESSAPSVDAGEIAPAKPDIILSRHEENLSPVQIIETPKLPSGTVANIQAMIGTKRLIFHADRLKPILSKVGDRPVALLTIAGPCRQGKSFTLNYMIKYLRSMSDPSQLGSDWMGRSSSKKNDPLDHGFKWRRSVDSETMGIWMWPQPFTLKSTDGSEIDVLLVDTEGVFDSNTEKDDWATIVGLSLLTSSTVIFNSINSIVEDSLTTLKPFLDYGALVTSTRNGDGDVVGSKPFQQLSFLIRDWSFEDDYPFGAEGGADFLKKNFESKKSKDARQIRKEITESFEKLDCFLMPDPGKEVKKRDYNGSVVGMDPQFATYVEKFIEQLFDPSTFTPKKISGNTVTGNDLYLYFEQYVKTFNDWDLPTQEVIYQGTVDVCNKTVLNKSFALYTSEMLPILKRIEQNFILDNVLQTKHESALNRAIGVLKSSTKMGTTVELDELNEELKKRIKQAHEETIAKNLEKRKNSVDEAFNKLESFFDKTIEEKTSALVKGPDDFVPDQTFTKIYNESYSLAKEEIQTELNLGSVDDLPPEDRLRVTESFLKLEKAAILKNNVRRAKAEEELNALNGELVEKYDNEMVDEIDKFKYWPLEEFLKVDASFRYQCFKKLSREFLHSSLYEQGKGELVSRLFKAFEDAKKKVWVQNENFLKNIERKVADLEKGGINNIAEDGTCASLAVIQDDTVENRISRLQQLEEFDRLPVELVEKFKLRLSQNITAEH